MLRRFRPDALALLGLFVLPLVLFAPVTLGGKTLLPADVLFTFEPWKSYAAQFGASVPQNGLLADLILENYVWKQFILQQLQAREIPLWNPYAFAGMPFLADGQHSALYPFSVIFYVMPLWRAYGWFAVSQLFIAGACAYVFLRSLRLPPLAAMGGAVVYQLGLPMTVSTVFPMVVAGAAWLPLILACIDWIVEQRPALGARPASLPWMVAGGLAFGFQLLAGHPEVIYYTGLISGAYAAYRLAPKLRRSFRDAGPVGVGRRLARVARGNARASIFLVAMMLTGVGVGAAQFFPLLDLVRFNFRTGSATFEQITGWAFPPRHVLAFLIPNVFGNPSHTSYLDVFSWRTIPATVNALGETIGCGCIHWGKKNYVEGAAYLGLLPLLLSIIGVIAWASARLRAHRSKPQLPNSQTPPLPHSPTPTTSLPFFLTLALLSLAFVFGTKLYAIVYVLPGIGQLHSPFRWVWPFSLCIAVLTGYGLASLPAGRTRTGSPQTAQSGAPSARSVGSRTWWSVWGPANPVGALAGAAVWGGAAIVAGLWIAWANFDRIADRVQALMLDLAYAPGAFADGRMFFSYEARQVLAFALMLIAAGSVLRLANGRTARLGGRPVWPALALGLIAGDLLLAGYGFNPAVDPDLLSFRPPAAEFLQGLEESEGPWRMAAYAPDGRKPFKSNTFWMLGLQDIRGYGSIIPKQYTDYMSAIEPQGDLLYNEVGPIYNPVSLDSPLLDLLNVRYVVSLLPIESPKYTLVYDREVRIYRNEGAAPRAFTLPMESAVYSAQPLEAMRSLDARQWAIVDDPNAPVSTGESHASASQPATVDEYTPNQVTLTASVESPSYLILADSFYHGWKAFLRPAHSDPGAEQELTVYRVNGNFRGVVLPPGEWTVRFKFTPLVVKLGAFVSAMSLMCLAVAMGGYLWRYFYRESAFDSPARRVAKNSLAPMALNLMNRGIDMLFAAFMLRLLGPGDAGKYYFAIVVVGWFEILTNYGLNTFLTREVSRDREHANRYLANTTIFRLRLAALALPVLLALVFAASRAGLAQDTALAIVLFAIGMIPASISTGLTALFYAYEKAEYPAALTVLTTILRVTFGTLALLLGYSFVGLAGVTILVNTVTAGVLGWLSVRLFFRPRYEHDAPLQRQMLRESFPLMLNHLLATVFFKVDVTLLQPIRNSVRPELGDREVGWYSSAYKFVDAYNIVPSFFTQALFPVMSRQAQEDRPALARSFGLAVKLLVGTALPLAVLTSFLAPLMIELLAGEAYMPHGAIALVIMVWSIPFGWINSVTNYVLIALDEQRRLSRAFAVGVAFNVAANAFLLGPYGYVAAAGTTIASEMVLLAVFYWTLRGSMGAVPWVQLLWRLGASAALMAGTTWLLWPIHPILALPAGTLVYATGVSLLQAFDPGERALLRGLLPKRG